MAFEKTLAAIQTANQGKSRDADQILDRATLNQILQVMFTEINTAIVGAGDALPEAGTTGQVLAKTSNVDGEVEWIDLPSDFIPLDGSETITGSLAFQAGDLRTNSTISNLSKVEGYGSGYNSPAFYDSVDGETESGWTVGHYVKYDADPTAGQGYINAGGLAIPPKQYIDARYDALDSRITALEA